MKRLPLIKLSMFALALAALGATAALAGSADHITINAEELRQMEGEASPEREKVRKMFEAYRPGAPGNGNRDRDRDAAISESEREKFATRRAGGQ